MKIDSACRKKRVLLHCVEKKIEKQRIQWKWTGIRLVSAPPRNGAKIIAKKRRFATAASSVVPHRSTDAASWSLASQIGRDAAFPPNV